MLHHENKNQRFLKFDYIKPSFISNLKNMAIRTALLTSRNINKDTDFSKYIETVSEPGVIKGLEVSTTKVAIGQAWVPCERTNGETIYSLVQNCSEASISGSGYVIISIAQSIIDNGGGNEDGTGIATIEVVQALPTKNYLLLAEISNGTVTDRRNMLQTIGDISTQVDSLVARVTQAEIDIQEIQEKGAIDHLEETGLVWELYTLSNTLFKQATPTLANSTLEVNVWDVNANKQIHIQRITSKTASNSVKLKIKKVGAPTTGLVVEVRNATQVDVSATEAYRYGGGSLICSGNIPYSWITTDWQEFTVNLNGTFGGTQGQLVDVVVYQTGNIVNSTNYYVLACDSTQYSEAFSYVSVNGETRTRSKLMPYCIADGFAQYLLCKTITAGSGTSTSIGFSATTGNTQTKTYTIPQTYNTLYVVVDWTVYTPLAYGGGGANITVKQGNTTILNRGINKDENGTETIKLSNVASGTVITAIITPPAQTGQGGSYWDSSISGTIWITANQAGIIRPLKAVEVKEIGKQAYGLSFGRIDGKRYGEFDDKIYNSATTGSITIGNCIGFKIISDSNGEQYKIPIFGV